mmetsp:Transcript_35348/g.88181  ORF Transcript_35348/g.88181 Transcript_35348/m.88181 type:complete len:86 (+) Transcript_35348:171-428(+)
MARSMLVGLLLLSAVVAKDTEEDLEYECPGCECAANPLFMQPNCPNSCRRASRDYSPVAYLPWRPVANQCKPGSPSDSLSKAGLG